MPGGGGERGAPTRLHQALNPPDCFSMHPKGDDCGAVRRRAARAPGRGDAPKAREMASL